MASAAAIATGGHATVFNAAGLHSNTVARYGSQEGSSITHYHSGFDVLQGVNSLLGLGFPADTYTPVSLGAAGWHGLRSSCRPLEGC